MKSSEHFQYKLNLPEQPRSIARENRCSYRKNNQNRRKKPVKELIFTKVTN